MKKHQNDSLMYKIFGDPKYKGKHVIVVADQIYTARTGKQAQKILEMVNRKYPKETPAINYIPKADTLILGNNSSGISGQ